MLTAAKNIRIKGKLEQPKPTRDSEKGPNLLEYKILDIKRGAIVILKKEEEKEDSQGLVLERETLRNPLFLEDSH